MVLSFPVRCLSAFRPPTAPCNMSVPPPLQWIFQCSLILVFCAGPACWLCFPNLNPFQVSAHPYNTPTQNQKKHNFNPAVKRTPRNPLKKNKNQPHNTKKTQKKKPQKTKKQKKENTKHPKPKPKQNTLQTPHQQPPPKPPHTKNKNKKKNNTSNGLAVPLPSGCVPLFFWFFTGPMLNWMTPSFPFPALATTVFYVLCKGFALLFGRVFLHFLYLSLTS